MTEIDEWTTRPLSPDHHMVQLDGLRGIAVFFVLVEYNVDLGDATGIHLGGYGVTLFYLLTGFLITGILVQARQRAESREEGLGVVFALGLDVSR